MKKIVSKNKGFTLIELLAVLTILAVIAVITIPLFTNVIDNARQNSAKNNIYGYVKAVALSLESNTADDDSDGVYTINGKNIVKDATSILIKYKGDDVAGELTIVDEEVEFGIFKTKGYDLIYRDDAAYVLGKSKSTTAYADGTAVYFNPDTATKCTQSEYNSNNGSVTNKKSGCMRWYTFGDKNGNTTIKMILDHNTSNSSAWVSKADYIAAGGTEAEYGSSGNNTKGPITVTKKLKDDTKNWKQELSPRLITANEIAAITNKTTFNSSTTNGGYYFKGNSNKISVGTGAYAWLYSYLNTCEEYGCNKQDQNASYGYATSDKRVNDEKRSWSVDRFGCLDYHDVNFEITNGVRPVIIISKSKLA